MNDRGFEVKPFHPLRRATVGVLEAASRKHMIHALLEVDVSAPRDLIRQHKGHTGQALSFTGYLIHCLAQAVDINKHMHAYRDWRNRLILFNEVDVSTTVEREIGGRKQVIPHIVRSANMKTLIEIHNEIREAQSREPEEGEVFLLMRLYLLLPVFIRGMFFRIMDRSPHLMKKK